jgi:hypothetical protein
MIDKDTVHARLTAAAIRELAARHAIEDIERLAHGLALVVDATVVPAIGERLMVEGVAEQFAGIHRAAERLLTKLSRLTPAARDLLDSMTTAPTLQGLEITDLQERLRRVFDATAPGLPRRKAKLGHGPSVRVLVWQVALLAEELLGERPRVYRGQGDGWATNRAGHFTIDAVALISDQRVPPSSLRRYLDPVAHQF